jgi:hypothetical protein
MILQPITDAESVIETELTGIALINNPILNKGTAFTEEERDLFHLHGLLPPHIGALDDQLTQPGAFTETVSARWRNMWTGPSFSRSPILLPAVKQRQSNS